MSISSYFSTRPLSESHWCIGFPDTSSPSLCSQPWCGSPGHRGHCERMDCSHSRPCTTRGHPYGSANEHTFPHRDLTCYLCLCWEPKERTERRSEDPRIQLGSGRRCILNNQVPAPILTGSRSSIHCPLDWGIFGRCLGIRETQARGGEARHFRRWRHPTQRSLWNLATTIMGCKQGSRDAHR